MTVEKCHLVQLPKISDPSGNLTFLEAGRHIPFEIRRVYYLYDVPEGKTRGGHAHRALEQFIIAVAGSFTLVLDDGRKRERFRLNRAYCGIYIPSMMWQEMEDFSPGSVCLVLASEPYDETDYCRDYSEFMLLCEGANCESPLS